ncbi:hypothetical protein [Streptomyces sp. NPDC060322]|uniref:hypothetical protein n=1 Tax=Streptomyces sp. NPDC060322 TaxID=3347097 RepID=UPI0036660D2E
MAVQNSTVERPTLQVPALSPADAAVTRQASHALEMLATTTPGRRRVIQAAAEEYLSQVDRRRLPLGYDVPITLDHSNRADAYRMRRGHVFTQMLGIACKPSDADLPDTARAILAAIDATPMRLVGLAYTTGQPDLVALLHMVGANPALPQGW